MSLHNISVMIMEVSDLEIMAVSELKI